MYKNQGTNFAELHKRLYSVLPEYKPISQLDGPGTYKSIDAAGVVSLVTISVDDEGKQSRSTKRALSADEVEQRAESTRRHAPHEGWERNF